MNEFKDVPSFELKKQIRGIDTDIALLEHEGWYTDDDTGEERFSIRHDYFIGDLQQRRCVMKRELARRWNNGKPQTG